MALQRKIWRFQCLVSTKRRNSRKKTSCAHYSKLENLPPVRETFLYSLSLFFSLTERETTICESFGRSFVNKTLTFPEPH